ARQLDADRLAEHRADHLLEDRPDLELAEEGRLAVDLGELGLSVGTQVLVPEALDDLVVAIEAGHHEHLLEQLRRLRQREELSRMDPRGNEIVAGAFRSEEHTSEL